MRALQITGGVHPLPLTRTKMLQARRRMQRLDARQEIHKTSKMRVIKGFWWCPIGVARLLHVSSHIQEKSLPYRATIVFREPHAMRTSSLRCFESLEPRRVMASFSFADVDGDLVTVQTSHGTDGMLRSALTLVRVGADRFQLTKVALNDPAFAGTQLTITARSGASRGDGQVNVGLITSNFDLGSITVGGDLASLRAGDGDVVSPGVSALTVASIGRFGAATGASRTSVFIVGALPSLRVAGDLIASRFYVDGRAADVQIGGSIVGSHSWDGFQATSIGRIVVGGSIRGGVERISGCVGSNGIIDELVIGGSLEGGAGDSSGTVRAAGIGVAQIGGSLLGGRGAESGSLFSHGPAGITRLNVGRGVTGGQGDWSGSIKSDGVIGSIVVGGSISGGQGSFSGHVSGQRITSIFIDGLLEGGIGPSSGSIVTAGRLGTLNVKYIFAGDGPGSGAVVGRLLGDIVVRRDIKASALQPVLITGLGAATSTGPRAIDSLSVGGSMIGAMVLGGWLGTVPQNGAARIGAVTVRGDMTASSVVAGIAPEVFPRFGRGFDIPIGGRRGSQIESFAVDGRVRGSVNSAVSFAVIADSIGSVRIGGQGYTATRMGVSPERDNFLIRSTYTLADAPPPRPARRL